MTKGHIVAFQDEQRRRGDRGKKWKKRKKKEKKITELDKTRRTSAIREVAETRQYTFPIAVILRSNNFGFPSRSYATVIDFRRSRHRGNVPRSTNFRTIFHAVRPIFVQFSSNFRRIKIVSVDFSDNPVQFLSNNESKRTTQKIGYKIGKTKRQKTK